ncbi:YigZ family protein [Peptostreptococcus russellii]|uniref:YigZ family protein n=1 Tax=Peptostreptococcus russellii TaxID=215200 RepID=UPI0029422C17|nr:YigZ family protein [Peptostreptococcus russellii]
MQSYRTLHEFGRDEFTVEKSVFIGHVKPVETEEEAREFIDEIKSKYKDATHNVWAYTIGETMNIQRYSDDGEPQGTAGIPTLEVIKKEDLRNVVVVVTRYFGGVKLGAGGLVRAYTKGAKIGLEAGKIVEKKPFIEVDISVDYTLLGKIQNELANREYTVKDIEYTDSVNIIVYCEKERLETLSSLITEITSATAEIREKEEFYLSVMDGNILL